MFEWVVFETQSDFRVAYAVFVLYCLEEQADERVVLSAPFE